MLRYIKSEINTTTILHHLQAEINVRNKKFSSRKVTKIDFCVQVIRDNNNLRLENLRCHLIVKREEREYYFGGSFTAGLHGREFAILRKIFT